MSHPMFDDLTFYSLAIEPLHLRGVRNVGWIDVESANDAGAPPSGLIEKLLGVICGSPSFSCYAGVMRGGAPKCPKCGAISHVRGETLLDAEIWVPSAQAGEVFASPSLILHYIEVHCYVPPAIYIESVMALDTGMFFNGEECSRAEQVASGVTPEFLYKKYFGDSK